MPMLSKDSKDNISPKYFTKNGFDKIWMMKHTVADLIDKWKLNMVLITIIISSSSILIINPIFLIMITMDWCLSSARSNPPHHHHHHHHYYKHPHHCQILVSVLNPLSPKKTPVEEPVEDQTQPTITLEVKHRYNITNHHSFSFFVVEYFHFQLFVRGIHIMIIVIIIQVVIVVTRFLASPTQLAASPRSWRCKHPWQPPALPPCQPPC